MNANLTLDTLRTFVAAADLGGHGRAGTRMGLTPAAISLQMKRLETTLGVPLFRKDGRGRRLTEAGELTLRHARRILRLTDDLVDTIRGASLRGAVRVGCAQDFAENVLPTVLSRFATSFPLVMVEVRIEGNAALADAVDRGDLDLALVVGQADRPNAERIGDVALVWIADEAFRPDPEQPLPLVMLGPQCAFRKRALERLDARKLEWRLAATSPSLAGLWASAKGGLGLTARTRLNLPRGFVRDPRLFDLPELDSFSVSLLKAPELADAPRRLGEILLEEARKTLAPSEPRLKSSKASRTARRPRAKLAKGRP
jgi:DNA-binding transcriptional LysR family regulator